MCALVSLCGGCPPPTSPGDATTNNPPIGNDIPNGVGQSNENNNGANQTITQPPQPVSGPGSSDYPHGSVRWAQFGENAEAYVLFEPGDPVPDSAPLIIFLHGFGGVNPRAYGAWIEHLVRRGNIVVFPIYQTGLIGATAFTGNAIAAIQAALSELQTGGHVSPELEKFALVGHSLGGVIAANIAASTDETELPEARALLLVHTADANVLFASLPGLLSNNLNAIDADTLLLAVVGDDDVLAGDEASVAILSATTQIGSSNKQIVRMFSDGLGEPALVANHAAPTAFDSTFDTGVALFPVFLGTGEDIEFSTVDALDYFGYWKFLDGLTDAAFFGVNREFALGGTPRQTSMGVWSDGTPVVPAIVEGS